MCVVTHLSLSFSLSLFFSCSGIRVLDGPLTDSLEAIAFNKHYQVNDIYSCRYQTRCSLVPIHKETDVCVCVA